MFSRQALLASWKDVRPYFIFSLILFFASMVVGGTPSGATEFIKDQVRAMIALAEEMQQADNPQLAFFWLIFKKNVTACVMTMYLGIGLGIFPLFTMVLNGMLIGFTFGLMADQGEQVWLQALKGLVPHGILELPALFLAGGFGMMLGVGLLKGIFGSLFGKTNPWSLFSRSLRGSVPALVVLVVVLFIAAIVESTISYSLMTS